jgi:hypothetical protein
MRALAGVFFSAASVQGADPILPAGALLLLETLRTGRRAKRHFVTVTVIDAEVALG